jgi:hypothetical protein
MKVVINILAGVTGVVAILFGVGASFVALPVGVMFLAIGVFLLWAACHIK